MHLILFLVFAGLCLAGAINLLLQSHPINSALSLIVVMTSLAVLYLLLGAEFLAAAQVIVYAGAIMVLFTFVVMLLNAGREERTLGSRAARAIGFPAVTAILAVIATVILHAGGWGVARMAVTAGNPMARSDGHPGRHRHRDSARAGVGRGQAERQHHVDRGIERNMKMRRTCAVRAPIDMRMPMSRYFSITIITSVMKIFSAATMRIRPITIMATMRSMRRAPSSCLLRSCQVVVV